LVEEPLNQLIVDLCERHQLHLISSSGGGLESPLGIIDGKDLFGQITSLEFKWNERVS
jgi:CBS domain containing-hemolysin-like protein